MKVANTLAYYDTTTISVAKSFIVQVPGCGKNYISSLLVKRQLAD
jgi:hypothetical protein